MVEKIFVEPDNTARITCPKCKKTRNKDVSRFKGHTQVGIKCSCGNVSKIQLEFRRQYRKKTELPGYYKVVASNGEPGESGVITVVNLSRNGLRMKFKEPPFSLDIGTVLNIRFYLDDQDQTLVKRDAILQNIELPYAGAAFRRSSETDNVIGFYLFKSR